jgi:autotransporter-associated beta strand protein
VRSQHFDGVITFEYLDDSTFAANKSLFLLSYPAPANTGKPIENRSIQMQMRHGNGDAQWKTARVALNKKNLRLDHHVTPGAEAKDVYFSALGGASNGGTIRNVTVALTTYEYIGGPGGNTIIPPDVSLSGSTDSNNYTVTAVNAGVNGWGTFNGIFKATSQFLISPSTANGPLTFNGAISGVNGLQVQTTGANPVIFNGANTFEGALNIAGAWVRIGNATALGSTAGVTSFKSWNGPASYLDINGQTVVGESLFHGYWDGVANSQLLNSSASTATWTGNVTLGTQTRFSAAGTGNLVISGNIADHVTGATVQVDASGGGKVVFSGNNTNTGWIVVANSQLVAGSAQAFGTAAAPTAIPSWVTWGLVDVNGQNIAGETFQNDLENGQLLNTGGNATWAGNVVANRRTRLTAGAGSLTISGVVSGTDLQVDGGNVILSGSKTYTGETLISAGTLSVSQTGFADAADIRIVGSAVLNLNFSGTDTVRSLYINGSKQAGGTWGAVGSGAQHQSPLITGTGFLQVANGAQFSDWATESGIPGELPGGDFDYDGIANLLEYALGLSPTVPNASPGTFDGSTISFNKDSAAVANGDVAYAIQTSTTLAAGSWTTVTPTVNSPSLISYTLPTGLPKVFARLVVTP